MLKYSVPKNTGGVQRHSLEPSPVNWDHSVRVRQAAGVRHTRVCTAPAALRAPQTSGRRRLLPTGNKAAAADSDRNGPHHQGSLLPLQSHR